MDLLVVKRGKLDNHPFTTLLVGDLELHGFYFHFFSPIVGMMIQSDFPIFQGGRYTTNQPIHFYDFHIQDGPFGRGFPANDV